MNQILVMENQNYKDKKSNLSKNNNKNDMKKIIMFFGVVVLIFGIAISGIYGYKLYNNKNKRPIIVSAPQLSLEEDEKNVKIIAKSDIGITKVTYVWNDGEEETENFDGNGTSTYDKSLKIPNGQNTLKVIVIDSNGKESKTDKTFFKGIVSKKPTIKVIKKQKEGESDKLCIRAEDEKAMKSLSYKWNDEDPIEILAKTDKDKFIETTIESKSGQNELTIRAVNSEGAIETDNRTVEQHPIYKPKIDVSIDENKIYMKINHNKGFKKIEFSINGHRYIYDDTYYKYDSTKKEIEYKCDLIEGVNKVIIIATSVEGTYEVYTGQYKYVP